LLLAKVELLILKFGFFTACPLKNMPFILSLTGKNEIHGQSFHSR
jgi:hypothetical protein